jgi:hypothetical protein
MQLFVSAQGVGSAASLWISFSVVGTAGQNGDITFTSSRKELLFHENSKTIGSKRAKA